MAFCAISDKNLEQITHYVFTKIKEDPAALKNFKAFSLEMFSDFMAMKAGTEKSIALVSYLPQMILEYTSNKENRKMLKDAGVSLDAITDQEATFDDYKLLSNYLGLKNEIKPIVVVNEKQMGINKTIADYNSALKVEITPALEDGKAVKKRKINGRIYDTRVTSMVKVGYEDPEPDNNEEIEESPALKHGNTIDAIAKSIFNDEKPEYEKFSHLMSKEAFDATVNGLASTKAKLEQEGYVFNTSVVVYDKELGISGEIDLVAVNSNGEAVIMDFKTANQRFNESYLRNENLRFKSDKISFDYGILSKWQQYATQGYIYGKMLASTLSIPVTNRVGIMGLNIVYDSSVPTIESTITKVGQVSMHYIPTSDIRSIYKDKSLKQIYDQYKTLEKESLGSLSEVKPNVKTGKRKIDDPPTSRGLDRLARINEAAATDEELQKEIDWIMNNPVGKDTLLRLDSMVNTGLFGNFKLDGITIYRYASKGTVYHEGWHRFSQVFMSKKEKDDLYESVAQDAIPFTSRDGRKLNTSTASFLDIEEFLAEEFAKYGLAPSLYKYPKKNTAPSNIFQRIWNFLVRYFGKGNRPIDLFRKLYRGKINSYVPSVNNAYWDNLNSIAVNSKGEEIIPNERLHLYRETMDTLLGEELAKHKRTFTALKQSKAVQREIVNEVFVRLYEKYNEEGLTDQQYDELYNILQNRYDFTKIYMTMTAYETLKGLSLTEEIFTQAIDESSVADDIDTYDDMIDPGELDALSRPDSSGFEAFNNPGNEKSAYSLTDDAIQDFFRTIPQIKGVNPDGTYIYDLNELGFKRNHKYYDVFYKTKKIMSGAFEMSDFLNRLNDRNNQRLFPELKIIAEKYQALVDAAPDPNYYRSIQNIQFIQAFKLAMEMPEINNTQVFINFRPIETDYSTLRPVLASYRRLSRSLTLKIISTWEKNFKDIRSKEYTDFDNLSRHDHGMQLFLDSPLYLSSDSKMLLNPYADFDGIFPNTKKGIRDFFETLGIEFNNKVFDDPDAVRKLQEIRAKFISNIRIYAEAKEEEIIDDAYEYLKGKGIDTSGFTSSADYIKALPPSIINNIAVAYFINNPLSVFNDKREYTYETDVRGKMRKVKKTTEAFRFNLEEMAELEEKYGERVSSGSFRIEDKTKYPYYLPNQLILTTSLLNQMRNIGQFTTQKYLDHISPTKPWMAHSFFYQKMFNPSTGERMKDRDNKDVQIVVEDIASFSTLSGIGMVEKHPRSLTKDEKFFFDIISLFSGGAIETPRAETSSTIMSIRLSDYGNKSKLPIPLTDVVGNTLPETFNAILKDYFLSEIKKRQWYMKNEPDRKSIKKKFNPETGKEEKVPFADQFNLFEDILSDDLKNRVVEHLDKRAEDILQQGSILKDFRDETQKYFLAISAAEEERFRALPEDYKKVMRDAAGAKTVQSMQSFARAFVLNQFILSVEFYNLYFGDLYYYKNPFKRGKLTTNTGNAFYIDGHRNDMLNSIQQSTLHSILTGEQAGGKDFTTLKTGIINDVVMKSSYVNKEDNSNILLTDIMNMRVASGAAVPGTAEYVRDFQKVKDGLKKYEEMNIADGQGIIGIDFYRNFSIIMNIWSPEKENEYMRQKAIFRDHFKLYFKLDNKGNKVRLTGEELETEVAKDKELINTSTGGFLNPLKISHTGPQKKDGPFSPVFDKFSVRPILPEAAIGKRDEQLLLKMAEEDIDYYKFESGTKVHQENSFDWYKKVADGVYDLQDFSIKETKTNELNSAFLKHQLSTEGIKDENILGSQFRKIVFGIKYTPMVRNNPSLFNYFSNLEKEFFDTTTDLLKLEQDDLFSLLGITPTNGNYRVTDMKRFLQLLVDESIKRGVPINNIDYIQYDEATKNAKYPIDYAFNRQQIQDLLAGLIDDRLRRLKVNGSSLIQVSSAGFESKEKFTNATRADIQKYGTSGLHYYHIEYNKDGIPIRTSTMGVKVALLGDYKNLLKLPAPAYMRDSNEFGVSEVEATVSGVTKSGRVIGSRRVKGGEVERIKPRDRVYASGTINTLERLNQAMKDPEWKKEHMEQFLMVGYRIPTQNNNFIDHMEIMEFLPPSAGAIIIPPPEIVVKSGSDFDIDKMNIIRYALNSSGKKVTAPSESYEEIANHIKHLTYQQKDKKEIKKDIDKSIAAGQKEIERLYDKQRKVRFTMLDMAIKSDSERLINSVFSHIENKAQVFSESLIPEEEAFSEVDPQRDVADKENVQMQAFKDMIEIDKAISRYLVAIDAWGKEKGEVDKDLVWFQKKIQYKNYLNNKMVDTLSKTLSHPYYFELLVTPSSSSTLDGYTNELIASTRKMTPDEFAKEMKETEGRLFDKTYTPAQNIKYDRTLEAFDNLLAKRKDLGGYAIQRTFADMFNFINFSIARNYTVGDENKMLFVPLVAPADREKVIQDGRILMHGDSVSGIAIKNSFDELITLTVDLANTGSYPFMGVNNYNRKHVQYLLHQKVDPKNVLWFINQPILKELYRHYENNKKKIVGYSLKHAITDMALRYKMLENPTRENSTLKTYEVMHSEWVKYDEQKAEEEGVKGKRMYDGKKANQYLARPYNDLHKQNLTDVDYFSFEEMDAAIRDGNINTPMQKKVLAYFASSIEESDAIMRVQFANNVDTTKYATLTSLMKNRSNKQQVYKSNLFDRSQMVRLEKESMIAPFDYTHKAYEINKALFPNLYTDKTIRMFSELVDDVFGARNIQIERISKIIENDYIEFVYKNFGSYEGQKLSLAFEDQLINFDEAPDHEFFSSKLLKLLGKYPELRDIPFVNALYEDNYLPPAEPIRDSYGDLDNKEIRNIFFLRNPDNPTFERNVYTNNWRNLISFAPERLSIDRVYSAEEISEIANFFHDLVYFSLYQSGLTNTGNGFSDLIPYEYWASFIHGAFGEMQEALDINHSMEDELLRVFEIRFKQMNPKINWSTKTVLTNELDENFRPIKEPLYFFKNYYRGKDYLVANDDLDFVRNVAMYTDEQMTEGKEEGLRTSSDSEHPIEIGRYVKFNQDIYIVIKKMKTPGVWQIYNPIMTGTAAKLGVYANQITTLPNKGHVIDYGKKQYLVTEKDQIIDLNLNKTVNWGKDSKYRKDVIEAANKLRAEDKSSQNDEQEGLTSIEPPC